MRLTWHVCMAWGDGMAPEGEERFTRHHNVDGVMEYWLESADLMDIKKEAGVQDPYWTHLLVGSLVITPPRIQFVPKSSRSLGKR
ncbi:hypothetical protein V6N13_010104 [Hibiscus sabdariffa]|uniref:Uncharacterized protein n=1 Tax=Hibiscus sabdariffa TaxID=183260 RepID=A0ABR2PQQ5_9ROSI